jgi:predicted nucleotidyltransferase component of viral defense system
MNEAIERMMARYENRRLEDYVRALREVIQEIALLGLWRAKFFEKAAFYGGTALRLLYGLDRFSEDLDFSLLQSSQRFDLSKYGQALETEMESFGFRVTFEHKGRKAASTAVQSAFLKADTLAQLLVVEAGEQIVRQLPKGQAIKVKLEIDTDPPLGFATEVQYVLRPIPFSVRSHALPDLFAGKMHAVLCRRWKNRVKGRDWYDFVWFVSNHPQLHISHLEKRMVQTGDWEEGRTMTPNDLHTSVDRAIDSVDLTAARKEVGPFVSNPDALGVWSKEFFHAITRRIEPV